MKQPQIWSRYNGSDSITISTCIMEAIESHGIRIETGGTIINFFPYMGDQVTLEFAHGVKVRIMEESKAISLEKKEQS